MRSTFIDYSNEYCIEEKDIAIITRGSQLLNKITPSTVTNYGVNPWKDGNTENRRLSYLTRGIGSGLKINLYVSRGIL